MSKKNGLTVSLIVIIIFFIGFASAPGVFAQKPGTKPTPGTKLSLGATPSSIPTPSQYSQLKYRFVGPMGNRIVAVSGVLGKPHTYYAGAASGGVWKSTDGGIHWKPIFDGQQVSSIGALAVSPSDPNVVWAGTGEAFIRSNISIGNGIYKSTDAGETWTHMGLEKTGRIARILIDPRDPNIVYAAAMGHCYGPQPERGVFRTTDGGKTWEKVLFVDENTGCSDLAMDPNNPRILFAGTWQLLIRTWGKFSGGPGSGLYTSKDGGTTWKRLSGHGLPAAPLGKTAVAIAPSNSKRVYALLETGDGAPWEGKETATGILWKSDDGGENWEMINYDHSLTNRPHYYSRLAVAPDNQNEVYFASIRLSVSIDGGVTAKTLRVDSGDHHDIWIDPSDPDRMIIGNDWVGINISVDRGQSWLTVGLPTAQMYHVSVDNQIPYYIYGNRQDGPSTRGPSNSLLSNGEIPIGLWHEIGGCECGFAYPDPVDSNIVWSGCFNAGLDRFDLKTNQTRSVRVWPESPNGWPAADLKYRFQWTFPIAISPHDHNRVYVGSQYVHQTTDGGQSWKVISPDLSTNDKTKQQSSGGLTPDNLGVEYGCVVFAIAESPLEDGLIWAGTNDGQVQVTRDGGQQWTNVTSNIPNLPPWGTVSNVEPSRYDAATCYITVDLHQVNDRDPYVYKTTDYGKSWKSISSDLPRSVFSYAHCVREDPARNGLLYLGTENAIYFSPNDGANWLPLQTNLPPAPVHWMVVQEKFNDLVVATYGRGYWIMDDITPLQQLTPEVLKSDAHFFAPRPAYRFHFKPLSMEVEGDPPPSVGKNPPYGATLNYYLKSAPKGEVKISILDDKGQIVRTLQGTKDPGINRIWWDLRYDPAKQVKLRTSPPYAPWVKPGPEGWRSLGERGGGVRILAAPGVYTAKLAVDGQEFSQTLAVEKDPNSTGKDEDIQAQVKMLLEIRDHMNNLVDMIDRIESIRKQVYDLSDLLKGDENAKPIVSAGKELDKKLISLEENLFQMNVTGPGVDSYRWPAKLSNKMSSLASEIGGNDFPPTAQAVEVYEMLKAQLVAYQDQLKGLLSEDLSAFNKLLREKNIQNIIVSK